MLPDGDFLGEVFLGRGFLGVGMRHSVLVVRKER